MQAWRTERVMFAPQPVRRDSTRAVVSQMSAQS